MSASNELLQAFRQHYHQYEQRVRHAMHNNASDTVVLWRLGDNLEQYRGLAAEVQLCNTHKTPWLISLQHANLFDPHELQIIMGNVTAMQNDIRLQYDEAV